MKTLILGFLLLLICLPPLHAQTTTNAPSEANTGATNPVPTGQAPEDVTNKISDLVHAGKYAEAQQLTTGLLVAYPNDQRLIKAKALIDSLLIADGSRAVSNQPTNNVAPPQSAANTNAEPLIGMEKVEYNSLIELARQAQQTTDLDQQNLLLQQFVDKSRPFLQRHPENILLWQVLAASALSLGDPLSGYEAGIHLLSVSGADGGDVQSQQLLSKLNLKGWLNKDRVIVTSHNFKIRFSEWYQAVLSSRARAELMEGQSEQEPTPPTILRTLVFGNLLRPQSNDADLASAKKDADDIIAKRKELWIQKHGEDADFGQYPKSFGLTMDEYRSYVIRVMTADETSKRLKLKSGEKIKLMKEGDVTIIDPDVMRMFATAATTAASTPTPSRRP